MCSQECYAGHGPLAGAFSDVPDLSGALTLLRVRLEACLADVIARLPFAGLGQSRPTSTTQTTHGLLSMPSLLPVVMMTLSLRCLAMEGAKACTTSRMDRRLTLIMSFHSECTSFKDCESENVPTELRMPWFAMRT